MEKEKNPHVNHHVPRCKTSWQKAGSWYDSLVEEKGHFYHKEVILPKTLNLLSLTEKDRVLDIGCGQGVFSRAISEKISYVGLDTAKTLLEAANKKNHSSSHVFIYADVTQPWPKLPFKPFTHGVCILAMQNIANLESVHAQLASAIIPGGTFLFVINHPCFRIPRQSRWGYDEATKTQTRELFSYMTSREIPIITHPGKNLGKHQSNTWSYHRPLSFYISMASSHGFMVDALEEWISPKKSIGSAAIRENNARKEFPLFMAIRCIKK